MLSLTKTVMISFWFTLSSHGAIVAVVGTEFMICVACAHKRKRANDEFVYK